MSTPSLMNACIIIYHSMSFGSQIQRSGIWQDMHMRSKRNLTEDTVTWLALKLVSQFHSM
jgi:hypothetical protein